MRNFLPIFALVSASNVISHFLPPSDCHINHVILDEFGDETSVLYAGATLKLVCVCSETEFEPFLTKTIFHGYQKVYGSNKLTNEYYTTVDGVVTINVTVSLQDTQFWCQNSRHYLTIPNQPLCEASNEICYNDHCQSAPSVCLDARNDKKVFKQVCVKGQSSNRVQADLCRHFESGSDDVAFMEVAQPKYCPEHPKHAGGFITKGGRLIQIGSMRTVLDKEWFSEHKIRCHTSVTPTCFLVKSGGSVSKVKVCGTCDAPGKVVTAIFDHNSLRGPPFHRDTPNYCRQTKLVCGDGKNFRYYIYLILSGTKYYIPDESNLENVPVCDWPKTNVKPKIGLTGTEE